MTYHAIGWAWLSLLFPSMGVMFALAGSLMARSLDRPAVSVVGGRMRRLLLPFWLFGALVVGAMLLHGWGPGREEDGLAWWSRLLFWIVPLADPPANAWAFQVTGPLWCVRTYVWFVLLSPVLLPTFRQLPWASVLGFLCLAVVAQAGSSFVPETLETVATNLTELATFGACWLLGFAHRDSLVDRVGHLVSWRPVAAAVNLFNARAVTVYLWHEVALVASVLVIDAMWDVPLFEEVLPLDSVWFSFAVAWPLIAVAIVAVGWVEDLAARRRRRLWPTRDLTPLG
ncbi:acyltransferase family protein [Actinopolymorpha sp. B11F2]|uniref:acyltransferase family protein n=1 Tax=Actinopolymorpha sp. B11F2 TaxID=3160862 RepID=UPI0032E4AAE0